MALPPSIQTVQVNFGPFLDFEGNPLPGSTTFTPSTPIRHEATGTPILNKPITVTWDPSGTGAIVLPATDSVGLNVTGFTYWVTHQVTDRSAPSPAGGTIALPAAAPVVDLDLVVPTTASNGVVVAQPALTSVAGLTGAPTASDLATALAAPLRAAYGLVVSVAAYGAKGDGTTDDRAAVQAAVDAAVASITATGTGAIVYLPAGTYAFKSGLSVGGASVAGIRLPRALPANLTIRGAGKNAATILLSDACVSAFWFNKIADYDTFQNIALEDFTLDVAGSGASGSHNGTHALIGTIPADNTQQTRMSFDRIAVRRVDGINLPENSAASARRFIAIIGNNTTTTQTSTRRVLVEEVTVTGGAGCAEVTSYGANTDGNNQYYDDIRFRALRHYAKATPATAFGNTTSFYICGTGIGDYCEAVDCLSVNSSDNVFEVGMMRRVLVDRVRGVNSYLGGFTLRNTHSTTAFGTTWNPAEQEIIFNNCSVEINAAATAAATTGAAHRFLLPILDTNGGAWGTVKVIDALYRSEGELYSKGAGSGNTNPFITTNGSPFLRFEIIRPRVHLKNYTADGTSSGLYLINLGSSTAGASALIRDANIKIEGFAATTTVGFFPSLIVLEGADSTYIVDNVTVDMNAWSVASGSARIVQATGGTMRGSVRGLNVRSGNITGASYRIFDFSGTNVDLLFTITDCDFSKSGNPSADVNLGTNGQRVRVRDCRLKNAPTSVTTGGVSASPWTYANSTPYWQEVYMTGGTVSLVERSDANGGGFVDTTRTSGTWMIPPGAQLRITYTAAPSVKLTPVV